MSNQTGSHSYYMSFLMYFTRVQIIKIHTKCIHKMMSVSFNGIQYWTKIKEFFKTSFQCMLSRFRHVQLFVTPMDPPSSSVHGILQARILEWAAMPSSRGSSPPRDRTWVCYVYLHWQAGPLPLMPTGDWYKLLIIVGRIFKE